MENNTQSIKDYIAKLDSETQDDANTLVKIMQKISGHEPKFWAGGGGGTVGFDSYHYKYGTGREGDSFVVGFYPRKGKTTIYLMDGTARQAELLAKLGKHSTTGYCIYVKSLADIDLKVLEQIVKSSYQNIKSKAKDGPIDKILWQTEK